MPTATQHRKVLKFEDDASIRNVLRLFGKKLEGKKAGASCPAPGPGGLDCKAFDTVLLDLRSSPRTSREGVGGLGKIRISLMGRVLTISGEVRDAKTLELLERYLLNGLPRSLLWLVPGL